MIVSGEDGRLGVRVDSKDVCFRSVVGGEGERGSDDDEEEEEVRHGDGGE